MRDGLIKALKEISEEVDIHIQTTRIGMSTGDQNRYLRVRHLVQEAIAELLECSW